MITSYKKLTGRYLRANRKKSILTVIGIVLSVALIATIGLFIKGIQDMEIENAKNIYGSYHIAFKAPSEKLISEIMNNPKVSRSGLFNITKGIRVDKDLVVNQITATDKALELFPYKAKEGRLPENQNEIAVEKWVLEHIDKNAKIGDKVKFNNKKYTLVGIIEDDVQDQIDNKGTVLSKTNVIDQKNTGLIGLLVEISSKTNIKTAVKELEKLGKLGSYQVNAYLLTMEGAADDDSGYGGLYVMIAIIIGIVVISTIAVIYNSFQISVVERIKQFGLLRAVGATPKQISSIVLREATILAIIGIPIGLILGVIALLGIEFAFHLVGGDTILPIKLSISPMIMGISGVVGLVSIYLSALIPAFFAGRISPLIAINGRTSITKEKIKRRKNRLMGIMFGFEGALAAKNIKRSRKRYRITVFSIIISVTLFITFKSFMDMTFTVTSNPNESKNVQFTVMVNSRSPKSDRTIQDKIVNNIEALRSVDKLYKVYENKYLYTAISENSKIKEIQNLGQIYKKTKINDTNKTLLWSNFAIYDNGAMEAAKKYLASGSINLEKLNKENGVILINKNIIYDQKKQKNYYGPVADIKVGDKIEVQYNDLSHDGMEFGKGKLKTVKVMAILNNDPFNFGGNQNGLKLITSGEVAKRLIEQKEIKPIKLDIVIKNKNNEEKAKEEIENAVKSNPEINVINDMDNNRRSKSAMLMMEILVYGFVVVVSLIGCVNIINTLTTNIIVRKREFGTLKSIGLTSRGLKKMIVLEGFLYGIVGTIYGSIIGCGLSFLLGSEMGGIREFGWKIPWDAMAISGAFALVIGYIAVLSPLSRIKKENIIEAVREDY